MHYANFGLHAFYVHIYKSSHETSHKCLQWKDQFTITYVKQICNILKSNIIENEEGIKNRFAKLTMNQNAIYDYMKSIS